MYRYILATIAVCAVSYLIGFLVYHGRARSRIQNVRNMDPDDLVTAISNRQISILEVPKHHRKEVTRKLKEIQEAMDQF